MRKSIIATLLLATAAVAQQTHNQYEPPNGPGAGQKLLAQFAGDWDVVKTFFPMNGKPIVTKGTCKQYMIQDGKFLQSDFTFFNSGGNEEHRHRNLRLRFQNKSLHHRVVRLAADDYVDSPKRRHVRRQEHRAVDHAPRFRAARA